MTQKPPPVPVTLVTGFLGAGKTTAVNHLLAHAGGRRIAAVVNDFGTINIDAELIAAAANDPDNVVSLPNGCICCTLEGDLLRTLATLLRRTPRPDHIVIETSGIADPADIVRNLMDPVIWREAPLDLVLCILDATTSAEALSDPLLRSQLRAADLVALSRTDLAIPADLARTRAAVTAIKPAATVVDAPHGQIPPALLFPDLPPVPRTPTLRDHTLRKLGRRSPTTERFETLSWTADHRLSLPAFQAAIGRLAPRLARAKGLFEAEAEPGGQPGGHLVFQLAGGRASLGPAAPPPPGTPRARLVFIAELGVLSAPDIDAALRPAVATGASPAVPADIIPRDERSGTV